MHRTISTLTDCSHCSYSKKFYFRLLFQLVALLWTVTICPNRTIAQKSTAAPSPVATGAQAGSSSSQLVDDMRTLLMRHREHLMRPSTESNQRRFGLIQPIVPKPFTERQKVFLEAIDTYLQRVPNAPDRPANDYRRARIYYEQGHIDKAVSLLRRLVETDLKYDQGAYAILLLDCLVAQSNASLLALTSTLPLVEAELDRFERMPALMANEEFAKYISQIKRDLQVFRTEQEEQSGFCRLAGAHYVQIAERFPADLHADIFLERAVRNFEKCRLVGLAMQFSEKLIYSHPESPLAKHAMLRLGHYFSRLAAYEVAADKYESFANRYPGQIVKQGINSLINPYDSPSALYTAIAYRRGLGQSDKSIEDAELFIKNYGWRPEYADLSAGVFLDIGRIYRQRIDYDSEIRHYREYLKSDWRTKGGMDREIVAKSRLAEALLEQTCPIPRYSDGLCIQWVRMSPISSVNQGSVPVFRTGMIPVHRPLAWRPGARVPSVRRLFERIKEARDQLTATLDLCTRFKGSKDHITLKGSSKVDAMERFAEVLSACARARIHYSDLELEAWISQRDSEPQTDPVRLAQLRRPYEELKSKANEAIVLAQSRIAFLYFSLANDSRISDYRAAEFKAKSEDHLNRCIKEAAERYQPGEILRSCEEMLNNFDPKKYPLQQEIFGGPFHDRIRFDRAPLISEALPPAAQNVE